MNKGACNKLIIILSMCISVFSILYLINSIKLETQMKQNQPFMIYGYNFEDQCFLCSTNNIFDFDSKKNPIKLENSNYIEAFLEEFEVPIYFVFIPGTYFSLQFISLFTNLKKNVVDKNNSSENVEGIKLTKVELKVFNLIQEFLNNNKIFLKEKANSYIKSRLKLNGNLNDNGIKLVINYLIKKKIVVEGSKLTRLTILYNSNRNTIFTLIKQNPGIYQNKLVKLCKLSSYVVKWHLSKLLLFNLIRQKKINDHISYFDYSLDETNDLILQLISKEKCCKIIEFIKDHISGCTKNQISKTLHMHYNTITKYINEIEKAGLLIHNEENHKDYLIFNENNLEQLNIKLKS